MIKFTQEIHLSDGASSGKETLLCPRCGELNLHHDYIVIYNRASEDSDVVETLVRRNGIASQHKVKSEESRTPSSRRGGIAIGFWCEHCDGPMELIVEQHKGTTYMKWRADIEPGGD